MNLDQLSALLVKCSRCPLRESASAPVPGLGNPNARYLLIGEAPGVNEDRVGMPFVGTSGKRLNRLLALAKIDVNDCYLTNVCRCLPPRVKGKIRAPRKTERLLCYPWLKAELSIVKPQIVIPLGAVPLSLFTDVGVKQLHGTQFEYELEVDDA